MTPQDLKTPKFRASVSNTFKAYATVDAALFCEGLTADAVFRLGGNPPVVGRDAVRALLEQTFAAFRSVEHRLHRAFEAEDRLIYEATVTYTLLNGRTIEADYANVLTFAGDLVSDYRIYIDLAPVARMMAGA